MKFQQWSTQMRNEIKVNSFFIFVCDFVLREELDFIDCSWFTICKEKTIMQIITFSRFPVKFIFGYEYMHIDIENWFNIACSLLAKREFSWNFYQIAFDYLIRLSSRSIKALSFFLQIALFRSACSDRDTRACINHKFTPKCIKYYVELTLQYKRFVFKDMYKIKWLN